MHEDRIKDIVNASEETRAEIAQYHLEKAYEMGEIAGARSALSKVDEELAQRQIELEVISTVSLSDAPRVDKARPTRDPNEARDCLADCKITREEEANKYNICKECWKEAQLPAGTILKNS